MEIAERMDRLENAHRALTAQHLALQAVVRVLVPLIPTRPSLFERVLMQTTKAAQDEMAEAGWDEEQVSMVMEWIDIIAGGLIERGSVPH